MVLVLLMMGAGVGSLPAEPNASAEATARPVPTNVEAARKVPWRVPTYTLVARGLDLREALNTFGVAEGLSVVMSDEVKGALSGDFRDMPAGDFLDRLATLHNLTWYYDGAALYVYGAGEIRTILSNLRYMTAEEVLKMLMDLGVEDARFPIKTTSNGEIIMVSGPPRYVALIGEMIQRADQLREQRTNTQVETRVFPLKNTWADDVTLSVSGPENDATIKGVAQLLQEIMGTSQASAIRDSVVTNDVAAAEQKPDDPNAKRDTTFQPVIRPDNRLNAVIVRDVATRMPLYEELIRQLDVPQSLVEIGVTVLELSQNDALDWQLSLKLTGTKSDFTGGVGQAVSSLVDTDGMTGRGLAGALTYLGSDVNVSASLSALRDKGKARSISRSTILTMNNMAAEMTDTQSYHARVVGTEVATLEEVTAGTTLQVKPRIIESVDPKVPDRVWLTMALEDGGFESVTVDSMPMTRSSSIETQALVVEGESLLLAGYLRDIEESADWGIPWLRDIPLIGWLFGGTSINNETVQRMFILTPYVIPVGAPDTVRAQASTLRDITQEEIIEDDMKASDDLRERRQLRREEARETAEAINAELLDREKDARNLRKLMREDFMNEDHEFWEEYFKLHQEAYADWQKRHTDAHAAADQAREEAKAEAEQAQPQPEEAPAEQPVVVHPVVVDEAPVEAPVEEPLPEEALTPALPAEEPAEAPQRTPEGLLPSLEDEPLDEPLTTL